MKKQHIVIGGGSGFIGRALTEALKARGDEVTIISRTKREGQLTWDEIKQHGLPFCDVVINLAGQHILDMRRIWNESYRNEMLRSRVETTRTLVEAINRSDYRPHLFISVAGKCFYGSQNYQREEAYFDLDEYCQPIGRDYPAELVNRWEAAANGVDENVRHVRVRLGIALANRPETNAASGIGAYGVFPSYRALFSRGLVFGMGSGVQPFPWIHIDDVVGIFLHAIDQKRMRGVYNAVAPDIVSNREFTQQLAERLNRRVLGFIPAWLVKAAIGVQRSPILLLGQRVRPTRTVESGYVFRFPNIESCLADLIPELRAEVLA